MGPLTTVTPSGIREAGAIAPLVALLHAGADFAAARNAAGALANLAAKNAANQDVIRKASNYNYELL